MDLDPPLYLLMAARRKCALLLAPSPQPPPDGYERGARTAGLHPLSPSPMSPLVTPWSCLSSPLDPRRTDPLVALTAPVSNTRDLHFVRAWHWRYRRRQPLACFGVLRLLSLLLPRPPGRLAAPPTLVCRTQARSQCPPRWLGSFLLLPALACLHLEIHVPRGPLCRFCPTGAVPPLWGFWVPLVT